MNLHNFDNPQLDRPTSRRLGIRIPAATDLSLKKGSDSSTAKGSLEMTFIYGCPKQTKH